MFRLLTYIWLFSTLGFLAGSTEETRFSQYSVVTIAPTKTSIYVGSVTMTMPPFIRRHNIYTSTYSASVFPYFFLDEQGTIAIEVPDDILGRLARGQAVDFHGHGMSSTGAKRLIEGRATPADIGTGKIKVRVFVSKRIQLIFNTTYRFDNSPPGSATSKH